MYFYWHSLHFNSHTWLNVRTRKLKSGLSDKDWLQNLTPPRPWWLWLILWNAVGLQQKSQNWSFAWCLRSVTYSWANRNEKIRTETKRFEPKRKDSNRNENIRTETKRFEPKRKDSNLNEKIRTETKRFEPKRKYSNLNENIRT